MNRHLVAALIAIFPLTLAARVEVLENGHVIIGPKQIPSSNPNIVYPTQTFTPDTGCPLSVISNGNNHTGGMISFGNNEGHPYFR